MQYVRGKENSKGSGINTLYRLADEKLEAIEFIIRSDARHLEIPLKKLRINPGFLIAGIIRNNKRIIPTGDDVFKKNDSVIVVTTRQKVTSFDDIFRGER